jgi:hypothetical protein
MGHLSVYMVDNAPPAEIAEVVASASTFALAEPANSAGRTIPCSAADSRQRKLKRWVLNPAVNFPDAIFAPIPMLKKKERLAPSIATTPIPK